MFFGVLGKGYFLVSATGGLLLKQGNSPILFGQCPIVFYSKVSFLDKNGDCIYNIANVEEAHGNRY